MVLLLIFALPPPICFEIIKFEFAKLTCETFGFGNSANIPDLSKFNTLGTLILNGVVVVLLLGNRSFELTPVIPIPSADNVNVFPSFEIFVTLLNVGSGVSTPVNDIIENVLIPTLPAKLRLIAVAAEPTTFIWSEGEKPGNIRSYNTVSALKSVNSSEFKLSASWNTDFTSFIVNANISLIDIFALEGRSFTIKLSPFIKVPVVCDNANSSIPVAPPFFARYPIAPLARPLTLVPWTRLGPPDTLTHFNIVKVWIS